MERPPKVLVVDDEPLVLRLYVRTLERAGFQVFDHPEAAGLDAALRQHQPDVVVIDLELDGQAGEKVLLDALTACGEVLRTRPRIVLVSGHDEEAIAKRGRAIAADAVISKAQPISDMVEACRLP